MRKNMLTVIMVSVMLCLSFTASANASGIGPGSPSDPLVSQSYVDNRHDQLIGEFQSMLDSFRGTTSVQLTDRQLDIIVDDVVRALDNREETQGTAFVPVQLFAGQVLIGAEGTEIILRSGVSTAWVFGQNGLSDVTTGKDVAGHEQLVQNHLLIVPRSDGRGVRASTDCWFLVKGRYTLAN